MSITFNPFTGNFDFVGSSSGGGADNFSINKVLSGQTLTIPENQEMILKSPLINQGVVYNYGMIRPIIDNTNQENMFNNVPLGRTIKVGENKTLFFKKVFINRGILRNQGTVEAI